MKQIQSRRYFVLVSVLFLVACAFVFCISELGSSPKTELNSAKVCPEVIPSPPVPPLITPQVLPAVSLSGKDDSVIAWLVNF